jgi:hypothetical protein
MPVRKGGSDPAALKIHPDRVDTLYRGSDARDPMTLSPDGEWILYRQTSPYEDILVSSLDGKTVRRLTKDSFKDRQPAWSADSQGAANIMVTDDGHPGGGRVLSSGESPTPSDPGTAPRPAPPPRQIRDTINNKSSLKSEIDLKWSASSPSFRNGFPIFTANGARE